MFLIESFHRLRALPVTLGAVLLGLVSKRAATAWWLEAWQIGHSHSAAMRTLYGLLTQSGPGAALTQARIMLDRRPTAGIYAFAALMEFDAANPAQAAEYLTRARDLGDDLEGMTDLVELRMLQQGNDPVALRDAAVALEAQRDTSPEVSRITIEYLLWDDMIHRRFPDAAKRAEHLLAVADNAPAELARWALALADNQPQKALGYLHRAASMPTAARLRQQCLYAEAIGRPDEAQAALGELATIDAAAATAARQDLLQFREGPPA